MRIPESQVSSLFQGWWGWGVGGVSSTTLSDVELSLSPGDGDQTLMRIPESQVSSLFNSFQTNRISHKVTYNKVRMVHYIY